MTTQTLVTVGAGTAVHSTYTFRGGLYVLCGAGGTGSGQIRPGISAVREAAGPVTCKRCLKKLAYRVDRHGFLVGPAIDMGEAL